MKNANKTIIINILSTALLQGIYFLTIPIFTRVLGTAQYGMYSVFNSWSAILTCIMGLGAGSALGSGQYYFKDSYYKFRSCLLLFGTLISFVMFAAGMVCSRFLSMITGYDPWLLCLLFITAIGHFTVNFVQNACIYEKNAGVNMAVSLSLSAATVILSLFLISVFPDNRRFLSRVYGVGIPYMIMAVILWIVTFFKEPVCLKKDFCRYGAMVGFPVVFHSLAHNILTQSDRVMMQYMNISNGEIGIYSLYYTISSVMSTILNALNISWCPFYYDDVDEKRWDALDRKCRNYIELFTVLTAGFLLLSREVSYMLSDSEYWSGISIIPVLVIAIYFTFMYQFPVNFEFFYRKTRIIAAGTIIAAFVNIVLNTVMIPVWGMYGAAIATAFSYGVLFALHYFIVTHMKKTPYHLSIRLFIPGFLIACGFAAMFYLLEDYWHIRWSMGLVIGIWELKNIYHRKRIF